MNNYTHEQLLVLAKLTAEDLEEIERRRRDHNHLDFAFQSAFMRVYNRFPTQRPSFEIDHELLPFVGLQLDVSVDRIDHYYTCQPTLSLHLEQIRLYLGLRYASAVKTTGNPCRRLSFSEPGCLRADEVPAYLTLHLDGAYDAYLEGLPENTYTSMDENGWHLSIDPGEKLGVGTLLEACYPLFR